MEKVFSIKAVLREGWNIFKKHPLYWIAIILLVPFGIGLTSNLVGFVVGDENAVVSTIVALILIPVSIVIQVGITKIVLAEVDGEKRDWRNLYRNSDLFLKFFAVSILYGLIVLAGFVLLIVPGVIFALKFGLATYVVVDKKVGPIDALKQSSAITQGVKVKLLLFYIATGLVSLAGVLLLGVGLLVAIPVTTIASALVYRELERQTHAAPVSSPVA